MQDAASSTWTSAGAPIRPLWRRPRLATLLVLVNLSILLLPVAGIGILRLYENALIRQTESELIAQGAFVSATFRTLLLEQLARRALEEGVPLSEALLASSHVMDTRWEKQLAPEEPVAPVLPHLNLAKEAIRPRPAPGGQPQQAPAPIIREAADRLSPILDLAGRVTLAAIRVVDQHGTVVASTRGQVGESLVHLEELSRALTGEHVSLLRVRLSDQAPPPITSLSRGTRVRVFVAMPVIEGKQVLGAVLLSRSPVPVDKALYEHRRILAIAGLILLGVVLLMTAFSSLGVTRPVRALIHQSQRAARGERGAVVPLAHPVTHEIAQLSEAIAAMARTLEARAEYIRTFAANVSHEFKTPLASMIGAVELLRDHLDEMSGEQRDQFLGNIEKDIHRLDRLVKRLLELARAEVSSPGDARCNPWDSLERCAARFRLEGMEITLEHPAVQLLVPISSETLESILSNLLENARHHAEASVVELRARVLSQAGEPALEVYVRDWGKGVSEANTPRIFEPFFTTARARGGTGMGLSIVRALVRAHGGDVWLEPAMPGTRLVFVLPIVQK